MVDIKKEFPFVEEVAVTVGDSWISVPADKVLRVCKRLRYNHGFDCLSLLTGTDRGVEGFEIVYHIFSYATKETVILKAKVAKDSPSIESVSELWDSANWMERETFDLLGIDFKGHPNLKRILLPEDWAGYPLRKDYAEQAEYNGMSTVRK